MYRSLGQQAEMKGRNSYKIAASTAHQAVNIIYDLICSLSATISVYTLADDRQSACGRLQEAACCIPVTRGGQRQM